MSSLLLDVQGLETTFKTPDGVIHAVNGVSFSLKEGETLGVVGESGCGKSVTMHSTLRLIPTPPEEIQLVRGSQISMVFQDPMTSLNPVLTIGKQLEEPLLLHLGMTKNQAR